MGDIGEVTTGAVRVFIRHAVFCASVGHHKRVTLTFLEVYAVRPVRMTTTYLLTEEKNALKGLLSFTFRELCKGSFPHITIHIWHQMVSNYQHYGQT